MISRVLDSVARLYGLATAALEETRRLRVAQEQLARIAMARQRYEFSTWPMQCPKMCGRTESGQHATFYYPLALAKCPQCGEPNPFPDLSTAAHAGGREL